MKACVNKPSCGYYTIKLYTISLHNLYTILLHCTQWSPALSALQKCGDEAPTKPRVGRRRPRRRLRRASAAGLICVIDFAQLPPMPSRARQAARAPTRGAKSVQTTKSDNRPRYRPLASRALTSRHRLLLPNRAKKPYAHGITSHTASSYLYCTPTAYPAVRAVGKCVLQQNPEHAPHCGISRRGRLSSHRRSASALRRFRKGRSCRFPKHTRDPKWQATCLRSAPQAEWSFRLR